jgi:hypothetical protein
MKLFKIAVATAVIMTALPTSASVVMLDFEGMQSYENVGDFYNGGAGANYGVSVGAGGWAWNSSDVPGVWANEPSPEGILMFLGRTPADSFINYSAGFTTGFSFFYTSLQTGSVSVYDGLSGTGNVLGTIALAAQDNVGCTETPNFCNWTNVGVSFSGTALSVSFADVTELNVGFDNVTFGSAVASVAAVPEPETYALMLAGLAVVGAAARRRQAVNSGAKKAAP